jgi:predicted signal transduction protein with EAL and GGDEF domain
MRQAIRPDAQTSDGRWWRGLAARSTATVGALLAGLSIIMIITVALSVRAATADAIEADLVADAEAVASDLQRHEFSSSHFDTLTSHLGGYAYVVAGDGAVIAGAAPPDMRAFSERSLAASAAGGAVIANADGFTHAAKPMVVDGRQATLRMGRSLAPAKDAALTAAARGLLATLAFLALALPAAALLTDRAAAPLRALARAIARPGQSQEALDRAGGRRDEIGALARAHLSIARNLAESTAQLHRLTFDDPVTLLPNRESLMSRLASALQVGESVALVKIEIEGLARVIAGLGQRQGDEAVRAAAARFRKAATEWALQASPPPPRGGDAPVFIARISDAQFAMLAPGVPSEMAQQLAANAIAAFASPMQLGDHHITLTMCAGVAVSPSDGDEAGALLRSADAALEAARAAGPMSVRAAAADLNRIAYGRLRIEEDLRRALELGQLEVHYQPQIALADGEVSGVEALVRWRHPTRGLVPPGEFVEVAEQCGLVEPLGRFVLADACKLCASWAAAGVTLRVAINVSTIQFRHPRFAETTLDIIRASGADPALIELEITESAAMGDPEHAARELAPLKEAGVRVAIDDFGTGYSNLATLTQLPFDVLKIDRAFVRDALQSPAAHVVVGTVIAMAEKLGFESVAEGVETEEQLELVKSCGATHAQGYLFARPLTAEALEAWYANRMVARLRLVAQRGADLVIEPSRRSV